MDIYNILNELNIKYEQIEHKPVFTIEEALEEKIPDKINGIECKNLFVKNKDNYYLIFMEASKRANLKELAKLLNKSKLSFSNEKELKEILKLNIGSVTPIGIINDKNNLVVLLIDRDLKGKKVLVHPNTNTKTMSIEYEDLIRFIEYTNHKYIVF